MRELKNQYSLRRQRLLRIRRYMILGILLLVLCMTGIVYSAIVVEATPGAKQESNLYKYFTEIRVDRGDTIWGIAQEYFGQGYESTAALAEEICQINSISFHHLDYGQRLIIPYYSRERK